MLRKIVNLLININFFFHIHYLSELAYKILSLKKYIEFKKSNSFQKVKNYIKKPIVMSGPFKGLNYKGISSYGSTLYPKLIGSYECELHGVIKDIIKYKYERIIDIGSAEGYYAVGIPYAMKNYNLEIVAVETSKIAIENLKRLASNNINNTIKVFSSFDFNLFKDNKKTLVIMDCEGAELDYLKKISKKYIMKWNFLIEVHVQIKRNIIRNTEKIFKGRNILKIRSVDDYHKIEEMSFFFKKNFDDDTKLLLMSENRRSGMYWLYIK